MTAGQYDRVAVRCSPQTGKALALFAERPDASELDIIARVWPDLSNRPKSPQNAAGGIVRDLRMALRYEGLTIVRTSEWGAPRKYRLTAAPRVAEAPGSEFRTTVAAARATATQRPCMCCRKKFWSEGIHNRLCASCRRLGSDTMDVGAVRIPGPPR